MTYDRGEIRKTYGQPCPGLVFDNEAAIIAAGAQNISDTDETFHAALVVTLLDDLEQRMATDTKERVMAMNHGLRNQHWLDLLKIRESAANRVRKMGVTELEQMGLTVAISYDRASKQAQLYLVGKDPIDQMIARQGSGQ